MFKIEILKSLKDNFIYALRSDSDECVIIDPGEAKPVRRYLRTERLKLTRILVTHHHWDHVDGILDLKAEWQCEVWGSQIEADRTPGITDTLSASDRFELFGEICEVIPVPGHTLGQIAYYWPNRKAVFSGDTLFGCGCGRLREGTPGQMFETMQKFKSLPSSSKIYFGHEYTLRNVGFVRASLTGLEPDAKIRSEWNSELSAYEKWNQNRLNSGSPTTPIEIEREVKVNPFLRAENVEKFTAWRLARDIW